MITTGCHLSGIDYRVDYEVTIAEGLIQYYGTLHTSPPEIFCFIVVEDTGNVVLFAPNNTEKTIRQKVIDAVRKNQTHAQAIEE